MIRLIILLLIVILFLIFSIPVLIAEHFIGKTNPLKRDEQSLAIIKYMFRLLLRLCGVRVTVRGLANIPEDRAVLYVGNHRSYFDILIGYVTVPTRMGFVAKKEMQRYPLLRDWMRNVHCLFLDRQNMKEGLKTILQAIEQVKSGISVWIFPEGTRGGREDPLQMHPFKEGSMKIAEKSGCPVVPVAISGSAELFERHMPFIRPGHVTIEFDEPFFIKDLPKEERKFAGSYTRNRILEMLKKEQEIRKGN